jgi:hypothetical protein
MKHASKIIISAMCALALVSCSSQDADKATNTTAAAKAKEPNKDTIKSAFEVETALRAAAKSGQKPTAENITTQTSSFILNLAAEKKLPMGVAVHGLDQDGHHIEVWNGSEQTATAEDLALVQTELQIEANGTKVCMRLAQDANLFITDVPAMKEQLTQYPKASGITKITTDGSDACKWAAAAK